MLIVSEKGNTIKKRAIIYARVSTDDQRNNYSIPSQVAECKKYIEAKGYALVGNRNERIRQGDYADF